MTLVKKEELVDGENEKWYEINSIKNKNIPVHLSHETLEIKYYFSPTCENANDGDWISCVKETAIEKSNISLTDSEALTIANRIRSIYVQSMEKWNSVYYYSYDDNGNRIAKKVITVTEGDINDHNLIIFPSIQFVSFARTDYSLDLDHFQHVEGFHHHDSYYTMKINIGIFYESIYSTDNSIEAKLNAVRENTGAHEIGHVLGLADLDE